MELHKSAQRIANVNEARLLVLNEARFPNGFVKFMDALVANDIVNEDWTPNKSSAGFCWCDSRENRGVLVETDSFPITTESVIGSVYIQGVKASLDIVKSVVQSQQVCYSSMQLI